MPLILVSNDDGVFAPGIEALVEAVSPLGDVIVVAPDTERSGSSHAITFHTHLRVGPVKKPRTNWWRVSGTPVDCVYIGLHHLCRTQPDLVVSGINAGYNLGTDVFYSGTVGAAAEARIQGVPALAASADRGVSPRVAIPAVRRVAAAMLNSGEPSLININVPRPPGLTDSATEAELDAAAAALPLEVTRQGKRRYKNHVEARKDPMGRTYYWIGGPPLETDHDPGDDTYAVTHGTVAVTPLELDITGADPSVAQRLLDAWRTAIMSHALHPKMTAAGLEMLREHIAAVPDFPKEGILFRDITPVLADPACLKTALDLHLNAIADIAGQVELIVGIESRGFLFGMPLAARLGVGFVPVRKPGKLPRPVLEERYSLEYGEDALQVHTDDIPKGTKVLIVDDLLATGGTASAACALVERAGANVLGCLFLIELEALGGRAKLGGRRADALIGY